MHPIVIKHFSEISAAEYHRIVQAREAVFFLEQILSTYEGITRWLLNC